MFQQIQMSLVSLQTHLGCPVCSKLFNRIVLCKKGHSVCGTCGGALDRCPICCEVFLGPGSRNFTLEEVIRDLKELKMHLKTTPPPETAHHTAPPKLKKSKPLYLCRSGCGVQLAGADQLYFHLHSYHGESYDAECAGFTFRNEKDFNPPKIWFTTSSDSFKYFKIKHSGLFALLFRVKHYDEYRQIFCWVYKPIKEMKAREFSFTLKAPIYDNYEAEFSDYVHGEQSSDVDVMSERTCLSFELPYHVTEVNVDMVIYKTTSRLLNDNRKTLTKFFNC